MKFRNFEFRFGSYNSQKCKSQKAKSANDLQRRTNLVNQWLDVRQSHRSFLKPIHSSISKPQFQKTPTPNFPTSQLPISTFQQFQNNFDVFHFHIFTISQFRNVQLPFSNPQIPSIFIFHFYIFTTCNYTLTPIITRNASCNYTFSPNTPCNYTFIPQKYTNPVIEWLTVSESFRPRSVGRWLRGRAPRIISLRFPSPLARSLAVHPSTHGGLHIHIQEYHRITVTT